jgi:hypothetical protein
MHGGTASQEQFTQLPIVDDSNWAVILGDPLHEVSASEAVSIVMCETFEKPITHRTSASV